MVDHVKITEIGKYFDDGAPFVVALAVCVDNRIVVKEEHWRIPWEMNTVIAARMIAGEYGCEKFSYQSAWTLAVIEMRPRPLRFLPENLDLPPELS
jgi:hypothetical protein